MVPEKTCTENSGYGGGRAALWWAEVDRAEFGEEDFRIAELAELAEELDLFRVQAESDPKFGESLYEWDCYMIEHCLWLALEQSCNEGVLLPMDQRALRLKTCPEDMLKPLRWFFELCPAHVKHHLALMYYVVVRIDRARRTGEPQWRPKEALLKEEESAFFRPPVLTVRKYTG